MGRKCSHCGSVGHNSRTCFSNKTRVIKLFGVHVDTTGSSPPPGPSSPPPSSILAAAMKKSFSMDCLPACSSSSSSFAGYLSDCLTHKTPDRKKGVPWTEKEHQMFLIGLEKLGKGDWRGISRNFVVTKSPTQVASHAQKYFIRQATTLHHKRRRTSLFDMASSNHIFFFGNVEENSSIPCNDDDHTGSPTEVVWKQGLTDPCLGHPDPEISVSSNTGGLDLDLKLASHQSSKSNIRPISVT
ncbi:hypothetical protein F2Q69_00001121 [Brassica cretica]|uniref:Uncharacterized protein n=1 Tax=Brassica cretica TaxID=69181 RepID=A0A8S9P9G9_BRACR|nr:hypothetical protein F2Q69_00001121 [Brassica cretica]